MAWRSTYFLMEEVSGHNTGRDCWLVIHGVVKNVTELIEEFRDTNLVDPILREAGQDVSYWFDLDERGPVLRTRLHPETGARVSALPFGIPHEPRFEPDVGWTPRDVARPQWWRDERYNVGVETARPIKVRIMNPLIKKCVTIEACLENTVRQIMDRYLPYNPEVNSYEVKYMGKPLREDWNLQQNNVTLERHDDSVDDYVPALMLYSRLPGAQCRTRPQRV